MKNQIAAEARRWIGTPFKGHIGIAGYGVDCVHLAHAVYSAVGLMPKAMEFPAYTLGGGAHLPISAVMEYIARSGLFVQVQTMDVGDMLGLNLGRVVHHVGIVVSSVSFVHAHQTCGVVDSRLDSEPWASRIKSIWRPVYDRK